MRGGQVVYDDIIFVHYEESIANNGGVQNSPMGNFDTLRVACGATSVIKHVNSIASDFFGMKAQISCVSASFANGIKSQNAD